MWAFNLLRVAKREEPGGRFSVVPNFLLEIAMSFTRKVLATAALATLLCSAAHAETLRLSTLKHPGSPGELAAQELAKEVEARTEGRVTIKVYPSDQLGDYTEVYEQLMQGVVDMALQPVPALDDKRVAITWFPYAFTNYESAEEMHKPGGAVFEIINGATREMNVTVLGVYGEGMGGAGFAKDVNDAGNPDAKHDLKVRVWPGGATHQALLERLGFSTGTLPWAELYTGMQTGIVDGQVGGTAAMALESFKDITKTWVQYNDHFEANWFLISDDSLAKLSEEDQKTLREVVQELSAKRWVEVKQADEAALEEFRKLGAKVITFDDATLEKFADVVRKDVWPKIAGELGDEGYAQLKAGLGLE